jgi:membrane protease subunit (stomatin/prohibitin family)
MGLFNAIKRQLLKVIEWNDNNQDAIVYRFPMEDRTEIMNGCRLIVRESQAAVFVKEGRIADVFNPGSYKLATNNLPILTALGAWAYGFESPFKAEVYFVNTKQFINQKWGTSNPAMMRDKEFGMIRVRGFGKYSYRVSDPVKMMKEIFGTNQDYRTESLEEHFRSLIVSGFSDALGESQIPALDLAANYKELSDVLKKTMKEDFDAFGIEIIQMVIENVSLPEEVEKTIDKRTSMGVLGDKMGTYMQYQSAEAIREAARNEGGVAGAGVGLGAGLGMGQMFAEAMKSAKDTEKPQEKAEATVECLKCHAKAKAGSKFCPECGEKLPEGRFCQKCGAKLAPNAKFCPECGEKVA